MKKELGKGAIGFELRTFRNEVHLSSHLVKKAQKAKEAQNCRRVKGPPENRVILFGLPPKAAMLSLIHFMAMR